MSNWKDLKKYCVTCGAPLVLNNQRDVERKLYCSRVCGGVRMSPNIYLEPTSNELEVIDGCLLGDGCIGAKESRTSLCFSYRCADADIAQLVYEKLPNCRMRKPYPYKNTGGFAGAKVHQMYGTYSSASPTITAIRNRWYPYGTKIVPNDLVLTPIVGLFWHLGDGGVGANRVNLSTQGFTYKEVQEQLVPLVESVTSVHGGTAIYLDNGNPRLYLRPPCAHAWLDFIGSCPVQSKVHRWLLDEVALPLRRLPRKSA